jgi:hypothetical protein
LLLSAVPATQAQEEIYFLKGRTGVELRLNTQNALPGNPKVRLQDPTAYKLFEVKNLGEPEMMVEQRVGFLAGAPECVTSGCEIIRLKFTKPVEYDQTFMLTVANLMNDGKRKVFNFKVGADAKIVRSLNADDPPSKLRVESKIPVETKGNVELSVERTRLRISDDTRHLEPVSSPQNNPFKASATRDGEYAVDLDLKGNPAVGSNKLVISGGLYEIPAASGEGSGQHLIQAEGVIKAPTAPKPEDARLSVTTATIAAVHQKPVFDLAAKIVPFRIWTVRGTRWRWEPTLTADVGGGQTKSANSVTVAPLNFIRDFVQEPAEIVSDSESEIPTYAGWRSTPVFRASNIRLILGPKGEFDRSFKRKNILGTARLNFEFHRWRGLISHKRAMLENDIGEKAALVEGLNSGLDIVPYIAVEAGGHVNNETVAFNKAINVLVPRHKILRSYLGVNATFEQRILLPMTLTIDGALAHLAATESIGFKTKTGAELHRLRGFQPRFVVTWGVAFDPAKHYSFVVKYENGRTAPNFEYLNKITTGLKVIY